MTTKKIILYVLGEVLSVAAAGAAVFLSAGRVDWAPGWAVMAIWFAWFAANDFVMLRFNPQLMAERMSPPRDAKAWDRALVSGLRLIQLARYILAGLDQRYGWTGDFPLSAQIAGAAVCVLSTALFTWALASNAFFSQVVRIQSDRSHIAVSGGPYRFVRHPGYLAAILFDVALSVLLASWWAVLAGGVCAMLLILRTFLEDRTLQAELTGYKAYTKQVRFRLLPGIW